MKKLKSKDRVRYLLFQRKLLKLILILIVAFWVSLLVYRKVLQIIVQTRTEISPEDGIDKLEKISLGDAEQWILIRGNNATNPVVLFVHGGPGAPFFSYAHEIGVQAKLEENFVMVYWEQRGTGKSYCSTLSPSSMTIEQFISDTHDLSIYLQDRFNVQKIILMARSWGSLTGLMTAKRYPELYSVYIGIGQMVNPLQNDELSYKYTVELAEKSNNQKALSDLRNIGSPPYDAEELLIQRRWLTRFYRNLMFEKFGIKQPNYIKSLLSTPEYSLLDILRMGKDPYFSIRSLWNAEFYAIVLFEDIENIDIPVFFAEGRYDYFTPSVIAEKFYEKLSVPEGKYFIWFEESGHKPEREEPVKFHSFMKNQVLNLVTGTEMKN